MKGGIIMVTLTNKELINIRGGTALYSAPTYDLFVKFCKFLSNIIRSFQR